MVWVGIPKVGSGGTNKLYSGKCFYCTQGYTSRCENSLLFGCPKLDGGQAEYVRVPLADGTLFKAPEKIPEELVVSGCSCGKVKSRYPAMLICDYERIDFDGRHCEYSSLYILSGRD